MVTCVSQNCFTLDYVYDWTVKQNEGTPSHASSRSTAVQVPCPRTPPPLSRAFDACAHLSNVLHPHAQLSKGHRLYATLLLQRPHHQWRLHRAGEAMTFGESTHGPRIHCA